MADKDPKDELQDALRAVLDAKRKEATEDRAARGATARKSRRQAPLVVALIVTWGALAYVWIARPAFIFAPESTESKTPAEVEAKARFALYLQRSRVHAFRRARGRLPAELAEAPPVEDGVQYQRVGDGFSLELTAGGRTYRLTNAMSADSFLGPSLRILRREP